MKRIVYFASILFLASSITSCQKEIQKDETTPISKGGVTVNVVADGNLVSDDASKTAAVVNGKATEFKWTEGDAITLYEYVDGVKNESQNSENAAISDNGYSATFKVTLQKSDPEGSNYVYTACYPAGAFTTTEQHNRYQIPNTQTLTADGNFDPSADIMFGKTEPRTSRVADDTDMGFSFKRLGTVVKLTIKGILKDEVINYITITAPEKVAGYSDIDFMTGVVGTVAYEAVNSLRLNSGEFKASGSDDGDVVWFRCIEGNWKAGDKFTIAIDTDEAGYTKEITIPTGGLEFTTGGLTKLTIGFSDSHRTPKTTTIYNKVTETQTDWTGEYLLVYENEGKAYIWTGVDVANCNVEATITDNAITSVPTGAATLTIAQITDGYSIKINGGTNDGKYIGKDDYNNGMSISETALVNKLEIVEGAAKISGAGASGDTHVTIRYNSNSDQKRFRYYKSGQQAVQLYKLDDNKTLTGIELNTEDVTKEFPVNGEFNHNGLVVTAHYDNGSTANVSESANLTVTAPDMTTAGEGKDVTVTYKEGDAEFSETYKINVVEGTISVESISLDKEELSIEIEKTETLIATISPNTASNKGISWSSDAEGIATVNENGVVTGVAVGTATITATSVENENISAKCTVTVTPKIVEATISLNYGFYGLSSTGNNGTEQSKTTDKGVTVVSGCASNASTKTYYDAAHIRYYKDSYLKISVDGTISKIVLSEPSSSTKWDGSISVSPDTYSTDTKTWTGSAAEVDFSFGAQNRIASIKVTFTPDGTTRYDVSCATVEGGTLSADPSRAQEGASVTLTATPADEYEFNNDWSVTDENSNPVSVANSVFTMPASNVTVSGSFTKKTYAITANTAENGTYTVKVGEEEVTSASKGDKVTLEASPADGYLCDGWTVTETVSGNPVSVSNNTFYMPAAAVTITTSFSEKPSEIEYEGSGTESDPYTVDDAIKFINTLGTQTSDLKYVKGTISKVESYSSQYNSITYWLDDDKLEVYSGKNLNNTNFSSANDLSVGDKVVVKGNLKKYTPSGGSPVYEFDKNNYIVSIEKAPFLEATASKSSGISADGEEITINVNTNASSWNVVSSDPTDFVVGEKTATTVKIIVSKNTDTENGRSATVTVSATGVTPVEITLTQVKAGGSTTPTWTRVTTIAELTAGGTFIMGYEATAKSGVIVPLRTDGANAKTTANGYFYTGTTTGSSNSNTISMANLPTSTAEYELTISASTNTTGCINLKMSNGSYFGATSNGGSKNSGRLYTSGNSNETDIKPEFSSETNNQFKLSCPVTGEYKYLKYNTGSPRFAYYNSAGSNIVFYKKSN